MRAGEWTAAASETLAEAGSESARLEAELLAAHALGISRAELLAHPEFEIPELALEALLQRRLLGEPMAYILGKKEFFGREFVVNKKVLIPRPETEILVEQLLKVLQPGMRCADIGTGSGVIAITASLETAWCEWVASDISSKALSVAALNRDYLGADVGLASADGLSALAGASVDVIACNPPYIEPGDTNLDEQVSKWEPDVALFSEGGTLFIEELVHDAKTVLKRPGWLIFEFGKGQEECIRHLLRDADLDIVDDLAGIPRIAVARFSSPNPLLTYEPK